jgi:hypothetical protein
MIGLLNERLAVGCSWMTPEGPTIHRKLKSPSFKKGAMGINSNSLRDIAFGSSWRTLVIVKNIDVLWDISGFQDSLCAVNRILVKPTLLFGKGSHEAFSVLGIFDQYYFKHL